jgi:two-component system, chemotaxis family, sensor kinase Cph1
MGTRRFRRNRRVPFLRLTAVVTACRMSAKGLAWTAAHLRTAGSVDDVRKAVAEARGELAESSVPSAAALEALEELALETARLRAELRAANRTRELLLASVAHDLRNPLNTFAMSSGLLRDDLEGAGFDRTRSLSLVTRMDRAAGRMQSLIDDLLEASRVEAGNLELTLKKEHVDQLVAAAIERGKPLVAEKNASLEASAVATDLVVEVDRARAVDALVKLVVVALKATGEGGSVRFNAEMHEGSVSIVLRAANARGNTVASYDETRGGLALHVARGLVHALGGRLATEVTSDGPRTLVLFKPAG